MFLGYQGSGIEKEKKLQRNRISIVTSVSFDIRSVQTKMTRFNQIKKNKIKVGTESSIRSDHGIGN